ncbi:MAG: YitT family protein [Bacteroidota bacterium]|nr:YitT family protein [Bacteroidota bacterium]MDP4205161.1 YitT family protein [Bacteroidota bacterium]
MSAKVLSEIKSYAIIFIGNLLYAIGMMVLIIPAKITGGGISGVCATLFYAIRLPIGLTYFVINIFLIFLAIKVLGAKFGIKTVFGMTVLSILMTIGQQLNLQPIVKDSFLAAVLGGILCGTGLGVVFSQGGSSGGTDIIAMIINKYRNISPGRIIMYCDVIIIGSSWFVLHSIEKVVYSYVSMWVVSYAIDAFLSGANQSAQIFIFSPKYEEIADFITFDTKRGLTLLDGVGWYTKQDVKVIVTIVRKREVSEIFKAIKKIDPDAFISMGSVMGVFGEGFEQIKH